MTIKSNVQSDFLKDLRENYDLTWSQITQKFNEKFHDDKTSNALRKMYKRDELSREVFLKTLKDSANVKSKNKKLEETNKVLLTESIDFEMFLTQFNSLVDKIKFKVHKTNKLPKADSNFSRTLVGHISDTHIGCVVNKDEMNGVNEFNNVIAARRFSLFFKELADYKIAHRNETDLILILNGDIIQGIIHSCEAADLIATQFASALKIFTEGISYVASKYNKVTIYCTTGNHGRMLHKQEKGRQTTNKWDSFETMLYTALRNHLEKAYPHLKVIIPVSPYAEFQIQGHNFFATHSDTIISVGNPGKELKIKNITDKVNEINASLQNRMSVLMVGHAHVPTYQTLNNNVELLVNGSLSGTDTFAQSIGIFGNVPCQQMFEVTKEYAVGDMRFVKLKKADSNANLDQIIEPLKGKF
jgi:predicted phosphodiesterase